MSDIPSLRIAVLKGGMSLEHEISLLSAQGVEAALESLGYDVVPVLITRTGEWQVEGRKKEPALDGLKRLKKSGADCVFLALHGANGEDGRIQGLLDLLNMPYTGSGCSASALAMDKPLAKTVVAAAGVQVAPHLCFTPSLWQKEKRKLPTISKALSFPMVVKAPCQGSSCGLAIVANEKELAQAIEEIMPMEQRVMVENFVKGREFTCAVLDLIGSNAMEALAVTEIRPITSAFFDYHAKYTPGATEEITPAPLRAAVTKAIGVMACAAHAALGCSSWSRSDFILGPDGPVWLEVNTLPGLTPTSLFPQAAAYRGIDYSKLIHLLILDALVRRGHSTPGSDAASSTASGKKKA